MSTYAPSRFDGRGFWFVTKLSLFVLLLGSAAHYGPLAYVQYEDRAAIATNRHATIERLVQERKERQTASAYAAVTSPDTFTMGFVGDIMLDRGVENVVNKYGAKDYTYPFTHMRDELASFDLLFGNLEGALSDVGEDRQGLYSFRMEPKAADALASVGFDVLSTANNHSADWGLDALADTVEQLTRRGIATTGSGATQQEAYAPLITTVHDTRIAFVSVTDVYGMYTPSKDVSLPALALLSKERLDTSIAEARARADIVVVSMHFGDEYTTNPNTRQREYARYAIDAGADMVVGHHPHSVQPIENYNGGYIAYSLGNFVFDQNFSTETHTGLMLKVHVKDARIVDVREETVYFTDTFQPHLR